MQYWPLLTVRDAHPTRLFGGGDANLYGYVLSDPINRIDQNGNHPIIISAIVNGLIGVAFDLWNQLAGCKNIDWSSLGKSFFSGAITGILAPTTIAEGIALFLISFYGGGAYRVFVEDKYNAIHYPWEDGDQGDCECKQQ